MKRILFMHHVSKIGGGSYCLLNLVRAIDKQLFFPLVALREEGPLADAIRKLGVEVIIFSDIAPIPYNKSMFNPASLCSYLTVRKSISSLKELLKLHHIDILYLNNMMLCYYLKPAKQVGCNTVIHIREHWPLNEHKLQLKKIRCCIYKYADRLIAINHFSAKMFPKKNATIVYDWIDMHTRYSYRPMSDIFGEKMDGKKVLLFTGGSQTIKGVDYLLEAFYKKIKDKNYRLLMLGCDSFIEKGVAHYIKIFLSHFGYRYKGKLCQDIIDKDCRIMRIPGDYYITHLIEQSLCYVSYFRIPHANLSLAENIILGNPCLAEYTEESLEYSGNGKYAMLVKPLNNKRVFFNNLIAFLNNIDYWKKCAQDGSTIIAKKFDKETNICVLNGVLRTLN